MKIQFLGTAAAEGIPAFLCDCEVCRRSRAVGGRALRTRSQAIIDDTLLIDFNADTLSHMYANNIDLVNVKYCLITHNHSDHLYPNDLRMLEPGFSHAPKGYKLTFCGSDKVGEVIKPIFAGVLEPSGLCEFVEIKPFETITLGKYTITALKAVHDQNAGPLFYMISDGDKNILYAHDTHFFCDEVWEYFEKVKPHFDFVSLDCTNAMLPLTYIGHMGLAENKKVREIMLEKGYADANTQFICNHFSHNGTSAAYDDFVKIANPEGFDVSYDGMKVEI
ncbi:MAG: hypothetical protein HFE63_04670 [Clostridiales bacterium]|nr:hypothetical protein [Clostridiales bacterium]